MDSLYNTTNRIIQETQLQFQTLGRNINASNLENDIEEKISLINKNCDKLDLYIFKLPIDQRQNAKLRCDQLRYDSRHLQAAITSSRQKRIIREAAVTEREQLLNRRFATQSDLTAINIDFSMQHKNSLQNANQGVDEMLFTGANTLDSLREQRLTIKGAHKRIVDMANTLGLSNHTMRLIEKRASEDKFILIVGVIFTLCIILIIIIYFT